MSLFLKDSFFCAKKNAAGETTVCCPLEGIEPAVPEKPAIDDLGKTTDHVYERSCFEFFRA